MREKLGIINFSKYILISKQTSSVQKIIKLDLSNKKNVVYFNKDYSFVNTEKNKFFFRYKKNKYLINKPKLLGEHQLENASTALATSIIIEKLGYNIKYNLFNKSISNTKWPGRLEMIKYKNKNIIFDGTHNVSGSEKLKIFLQQNRIRPLVLFGMLNNKKIFKFLKTIQNDIEKILAIKIPKEKNSFSTTQIDKNCKKLSIDCIKMSNLTQANKYILKTKNKYILITGSLYLVGKIRKKYL